MKKVYLVIGSNNFWYSLDTKKKDAIKVAKEVISFRDANGEDVNYNYSDEESNHNPKTPEQVFVYEARQIEEFSNDNCQNDDCFNMAIYGKDFCEECGECKEGEDDN